MNDTHLEERVRGTLSLAAMLVELSQAIRPRQEAWLLAHYGMTWGEAAARPQHVKDEMQTRWAAYWERECKEGRGL